MGPWVLAASIVNVVVGGGIFAVPSALSAAAGLYAPLVFLVCALVVGCVAICFAEAGSRVPTSGGPYGTIEAAFGPLAGYTAGTLLWVSDVLACGGIAAALGDTASASVPEGARGPARVAIVVLVIGAVAIVNLGGVARAARIVSAATAVKLVPLAVFVVAGVTALRTPLLIEPVPAGSGEVGRALMLALFTFTGMECALGASGEAAEPSRTIPRALAISMGSVTVLFVAVQVIAQGLLGASLAKSPVPLADAMASVHPALRLLMLAGAAASMLGWIGSDMLGSPRIVFALARDGWLPRRLADVHPRTHVPHVAIVCYAMLAIALALSGTFAELAVLAALAMVPIYVGGCAAAWTLARRGVALAGTPLAIRGLGIAALTGIVGTLAIGALASRVEMAGLFALLAVCGVTYVLLSARAPLACDADYHCRVARAGSDVAGANESAAARALATGDALRALSVVGRASGALSLALRGIAYAQLGDLELARDALERAADEAKDTRLLARVRAALVEVALGEGDVARAALEARASADELKRLGDFRNAAMQRLVLARAQVLLGRLGEARSVVAEVLATELQPEVRPVASLAEAEIATRALAAKDARAAVSRARSALERAPNRLLAREIDALEAELSRPVARIERSGEVRDADLFAIEEAASGALFLVDACRRLLSAGRARIPLSRRPVLFTLVVELARAAPGSVPRDVLAQRVFEARRVNASHRGRLRVEIGRLRKLLEGLGAEPVATADGYVLASQRTVAVLVPRDADDASRVALLLADGAAWSAQRVSETAGISKRTAQRALGDLVASGRAVRAGSGRNVRYHRPAMPIASRMLLLGLAPHVSEEDHGDTP